MKTILQNHEFKFLAMTAFLYLVLCNMFAYWYVPVKSNFILTLSVLFSFFLFLGFLILVSLSRRLFSVFMFLIFLFSSMLTFIMFNHKIGISENIIAYAMKMDMDEFRIYISPTFFFWVGGHILIAAILVYNYIKLIYNNIHYSLSRSIKAIILLVIMIILFILTQLAPPRILLRSMATHDLPYSFFYSSFWYMRSLEYLSSHRTPLPIQGSSSGADEINVVLIIGDSARADRFHCFGYERKTTPHIDEINPVLYPKARASFSYTRWSVPCMLTRATARNLTDKYREKTFISYFRDMGFFTAWISNQKYMNERHITPITACALEAEYVYFHDQIRSNNIYYRRLDGELLPKFDDVLKNESRQKLIIIHSIGSKWSYDSHYSDNFNIFRPTIKDEDAFTQYNTVLGNSYDNTIMYTDFFISEIIFRLKNTNSLVFYISDHGEMLGEYGLYRNGHKLKYEEEYHIPFIVWASDTYKNRYREKYAKLTGNRKEIISHDNIFHSIIDGAGIKSPLVVSGLSIFR